MNSNNSKKALQLISYHGKAIRLLNEIFFSMEYIHITFLEQVSQSHQFLEKEQPTESTWEYLVKLLQATEILYSYSLYQKNYPNKQLSQKTYNLLSGISIPRTGNNETIKYFYFIFLFIFIFIFISFFLFFWKKIILKEILFFFFSNH